MPHSESKSPDGWTPPADPGESVRVTFYTPSDLAVATDPADIPDQTRYATIESYPTRHCVEFTDGFSVHDDGTLYDQNGGVVGVGATIETP